MEKAFDLKYLLARMIYINGLNEMSDRVDIIDLFKKINLSNPSKEDLGEFRTWISDCDHHNTIETVKLQNRSGRCKFKD